MFRWPYGKAEAHSFDEDSEPKQVWWIKPITDEVWAVLQSSILREQESSLRLGAQIADPAVTRRAKAIEREGLAGAIERVENLQESGDSITDHDRIVEALASMPMIRYQKILKWALDSMEVTEAERKA